MYYWLYYRLQYMVGELGYFKKVLVGKHQISHCFDKSVGVFVAGKSVQLASINVKSM